MSALAVGYPTVSEHLCNHRKDIGYGHSPGQKVFFQPSGIDSRLGKILWACMGDSNHPALSSAPGVHGTIHMLAVKLLHPSNRGRLHPKSPVGMTPDAR